MKINRLKEALASRPNAYIRFELPDGGFIPAHAHVTEAARIDKRFVDCGGTFRESSFCRLQTWVADDMEHRLTAEKLLKILKKAERVLLSDELDIDVEYELQYITQFPVETVTPVGSDLVLKLGLRHTACLAIDQCSPKPPKIQFFHDKRFDAGQKTLTATACCREPETCCKTQA